MIDKHLKSLIERADDITKSEIEALIEGKTIEKAVHEDITYNDVYDNLDNLWNFMFFTGYFKKISERMDENTQEKFVELAIPNLEVKYIFRTKILKWFNEKIKSEDLSLLYTSIFDKAVIIEMKVCDKPKELFTKPQDTLQQIEDKKYAYELNQKFIFKYSLLSYYF